MRRLSFILILVLSAITAVFVYSKFAKNPEQQTELAASGSANSSDSPVSAAEQERIDKAIEVARQMAEEEATQHRNKPAMAEAPAAVPVEKALALSQSDKASATAAIEAWRSAWSSQNIEQYLSSYAPDFEVPGDMSRAKWEALRRQRIGSQTDLNISIADLQIESQGGKVVARFKQNYKSSKLTEISSKTLLLDRQEGRWLIIQEVSR